MKDLVSQSCQPCSGATPPLEEETVKNLLTQLSGWEKVDQKIVKNFFFKNYYETLAFVNAVAFIAHQENHHPEMQVAYKTCKVEFSTHSIGGLSQNDFICAAKVDLLFLAPSLNA